MRELRLAPTGPAQAATQGAAEQPDPGPMLRWRHEPAPERRLLGMIHDLDSAGVGWLVMGVRDDDHVLEARMLPHEIAKETATRCARAVAAAVLVDVKVKEAADASR